MKIEVIRYSSGHESTLSIILIDKEFFGYGLEDEFRTVKVWGETRIPAGTYPIKLRTEGSHHERYLAKYGPDWHKGMLHVLNVPNFTFILHHTGNKDDDTAGCLVGGMKANNNQYKNTEGYVSESTLWYENYYPVVRDAILKGEPVHVTYIDYDNAKN